MIEILLLAGLGLIAILIYIAMRLDKGMTCINCGKELLEMDKDEYNLEVRCNNPKCKLSDYLIWFKNPLEM